MTSGEPSPPLTAKTARAMASTGSHTRVESRVTSAETKLYSFWPFARLRCESVGVLLDVVMQHLFQRL